MIDDMAKIDTALWMMTYAPGERDRLRARADEYNNKADEMHNALIDAQRVLMDAAINNSNPYSDRIACYSAVIVDRHPEWIAYLDLIVEHGPSDARVIETGKDVAKDAARSGLLRDMIYAAHEEYKRLHDGME